MLYGLSFHFTLKATLSFELTAMHFMQESWQNVPPNQSSLQVNKTNTSVQKHMYNTFNTVWRQYVYLLPTPFPQFIYQSPNISLLELKIINNNTTSNNTNVLIKTFLPWLYPCHRGRCFPKSVIVPLKCSVISALTSSSLVHPKQVRQPWRQSQDMYTVYLMYYSQS